MVGATLGRLSLHSDERLIRSNQFGVRAQQTRRLDYEDVDFGVVALPSDYWESFDRDIESLADFLEAVRMISAYQAATQSRFVWRGAADAAWPLYSSLVRRYSANHGTTPMEPTLRTFEREVIDEAREWGLDWHHSGGRLSALELLAALQHYGVPTRLLDFTFNPLVACWFAVASIDNEPGRVFAIDISDRLISREKATEAEPWWLAIDPGTTTEWATQSWIWRPPPLEPRIVRQDGCFLMGGIPSTNPARNRRTATGAWALLHANEVRECMSVPFKLIHYDQAVAAFSGQNLVGAPPKARAFTLKIVGEKQALRAELAQGFGLTHRSMFPDFPGLAQFGRSFA